MFLVHKKIKTSFHTVSFHLHNKSYYNFILLQNTELNFACSQCPKRYASMHTLNNHIKKAHNKEVSKVQCPDCGNFFSSAGTYSFSLKKFLIIILILKAALRKHSSLHKPPELPCPICGKLFHNQTYLMRHATSVHGESEDKKFKVINSINVFQIKYVLFSVRFVAKDLQISMPLRVTITGTII